MSALASIVIGIGGIVHSLIGIYIWMIIIAAILTWIPPFSGNAFVQTLIRIKYKIYPFMMQITEPAYALVRRLIPTSFNGVDMAPLVIIIGLQVLDIVLITLINTVATSI
jgi:YggT family protein